jgi:hypothetical protein
VPVGRQDSGCRNPWSKAPRVPWTQAAGLRGEGLLGGSKLSPSPSLAQGWIYLGVNRLVSLAPTHHPGRSGLFRPLPPPEAPPYVQPHAWGLQAPRASGGSQFCCV